MEKLISKKGFNLPKSQNIQTFYEVEIEPFEKGLYRVRSGNFKGLLKERQLAELREQIAAEQQEDKDLADAKLLIEKKREELQAKAEKIKKELVKKDIVELKTILDEMSIGYYEDAKESELIELIVKGELNGVQRVKKETEKPTEKKQPKAEKPVKPVVEQ